MSRNPALLLKDIRSAINAILDFIDEMNFDDFINDDKTKSAVIQKYEVIGEATKMLDESIKHQYSEIPWKEMAGMRDRLIHQYFGIDEKLVWETTKHLLPDLKDDIKRILDQQFPQDSD